MNTEDLQAEKQRIEQKMRDEGNGEAADAFAKLAEIAVGSTNMQRVQIMFAVAAGMIDKFRDAGLVKSQADIEMISEMRWNAALLAASEVENALLKSLCGYLSKQLDEAEQGADDYADYTPEQRKYVCTGIAIGLQALALTGKLNPKQQTVQTLKFRDDLQRKIIEPVKQHEQARNAAPDGSQQ